MSLLSIIVPAYNIENYLERCIISIVNQTYSKIEIIIIDDGSSDRTGELADQLADKYLEKVICIHQANSGVTEARITGIKAARGEWIGFVDGDDEIEVDMYERLIKNAQKYNADISHCGYQTIVNGGERIHFFHNTGKILIQDNYTGKRDLLLGNQIEPGIWNKIYKKELIDRMITENKLDHTIKINEDVLMNYILFDYAQKAVYEDFCPYHYMTRSDSASRTSFNVNRALDPVKVRKWIVENCDDELKPLAWRKYLFCCFNAYQTLWQQKHFSEEARDIKHEIFNQRSKIKYLTKIEQTKLFMIVYFPHIYNFIYSIYVKHFQKKDYE